MALSASECGERSYVGVVLSYPLILLRIIPLLLPGSRPADGGCVTDCEACTVAEGGERISTHRTETTFLPSPFMRKCVFLSLIIVLTHVAVYTVPVVAAGARDGADAAEQCGARDSRGRKSEWTDKYRSEVRSRSGNHPIRPHRGYQP